MSDVIDKLARTPLSQVILFVGACTLLRLLMAPYLANTAPHKRGGGYKFLRFSNEALDAIIYAGVFVFLLIRPFVIQAFKIPTGSMLETLQLNDFIVANKAIYRYTDPQVGEIVVFRPPIYAVEPQFIRDGEVDVDYIKRCVGTPGDLVEIKGGVLYRNGRAIKEPFIREEPNWDFKLVRFESPSNPLLQQGKDATALYWPVLYNGVEVNFGNSGTAPRYQVPPQNPAGQELLSLPAATIPPDYYLMVGDNRNQSFDGRAWGLVHRSQIIGRSEFIWFPPKRWQKTESNDGEPVAR